MRWSEELAPWALAIGQGVVAWAFGADFLGTLLLVGSGFAGYFIGMEHGRLDADRYRG